MNRSNCRQFNLCLTFGKQIIVGLEETVEGGGTGLICLISKGSDLSGDRSDQTSVVGVVEAEERIELKSSSNPLSKGELKQILILCLSNKN